MSVSKEHEGRQRTDQNSLECGGSGCDGRSRGGELLANKVHPRQTIQQHS